MDFCSPKRPNNNLSTKKYPIYLFKFLLKGIVVHLIAYKYHRNSHFIWCLFFFFSNFHHCWEPAIVMIVISHFFTYFNDDFADMSKINGGLPAQQICQKYLTRNRINTVLYVWNFSFFDGLGVKFDNFSVFPQILIKNVRKWIGNNLFQNDMIHPFDLFLLKIEKQYKLTRCLLIIYGSLNEILSQRFDDGDCFTKEEKLIFIVWSCEWLSYGLEHRICLFYWCIGLRWLSLTLHIIPSNN